VLRRVSTDPELAAIELVYRERFQSFVRLATAITRDEQAALDAVHDGFVRAVRYRETLRDLGSASVPALVAGRPGSDDLSGTAQRISVLSAQAS
jgi:hypothetical protein